MLIGLIGYITNHVWISMRYDHKPYTTVFPPILAQMSCIQSCFLKSCCQRLLLILKVIADHPIFVAHDSWPTSFDPGRRQRAKPRRSCWLSCDSSSLVPPDGWSSHPADHWLHQVTAGYCRCRSAWEKLRKHLNIGLGILRLALTSAFYAFVRDSVDSVYLVLEHVKSKICLKEICEDVPNLELDMEELIGSLKLSMGWTGWTMNWKGILQNQPVLASALGGGQPSGPERSQRSSGSADDDEFLPNFEQKCGVNNGYNSILWGYNMGHIYIYSNGWTFQCELFFHHRSIINYMGSPK